MSKLPLRGFLDLKKMSFQSVSHFFNWLPVPETRDTGIGLLRHVRHILVLCLTRRRNSLLAPKRKEAAGNLISTAIKKDDTQYEKVTVYFDSCLIRFLLTWAMAYQAQKIHISVLRFTKKRNLLC